MLRFLQLFTLLLCSITFHCHSQSLSITGTVIDSTLEKNIPFGKAILIKVKDSTLFQYKTINSDGTFAFDVPIDTFRLIINHPKFDEKEFLIVGSKTNHTIDLNEIYLPEKGKGLEEVVIFAYKEPVYYKGDTLVYIADSFKTRPNAMVEDLLKKLPGIKVEKDGSIKTQGKEVKRVLVDGDEFFGSDATLATRNLSATSIQTVEIYEQADEGASDSDQKIQVLDLKLKESAKRGYFGEVTLGSNFQKFHEGRILANYFTPKHKVSIYGAGANTLESTLSWSQMSKYGMGNLQAYQYDAETDSWDRNENAITSTSGLPLLWRTGVYYQGEISKKINFGVNYTFTDYKLSKTTESNTRYNFADTTYSNAYKSISKQHTQSHEVNLQFEYKIDSSQTLSFKPKLYVNKNSNDLNSTTNFLNQDQFATRNSIQTNENSRDGFNIKTPLFYTKNFRKKGRKIVILNNFTYDSGKSKGTINYSDVNPITNQTFYGVNQIKNGTSNIISNLSKVTFYEPLGKKSKLSFFVEQFNTKNTDNLFSYNPVNGVYDELDSLTSNQFQSVKNKSTAGVKYLYEFRKIKFNVGLDLSYFNSKNENIIKNNTIYQNQLFVLPSFDFKYNQSRSAQLSIRGTTQANLPNNSILQPVVNNNNPNFIQLGAPDIKPMYITNANISYNFYKPTQNSWYYFYFNSSYIHNAYVSDLTFDENGRQFSTYYNKSKWNYSSIGFNLSQQLYKDEISISPSFEYAYSPEIGRVNGKETQTINHKLEPGLSLDFDYDFMYASIGASYAFNKRTSDQAEINTYVNSKWQYEAEFLFYLPWKMEFSFSANFTQFEKMAKDYNINRFLLSAKIDQKFGKTDAWIVTAQIHDIFNQNQEIYRSNTVNMITDSRVNNIARYFMLKLTYKFNSTQKTKKNKTDENDNIDID